MSDPDYPALQRLALERSDLERPTLCSIGSVATPPPGTLADEVLHIQLVAIGAIGDDDIAATEPDPFEETTYDYR